MERTTLFELFRSFFKIGLFTFGGGYAMVPLIEAEIIERRRWLPQGEFLDLLTLAQSSPGPIAVNTSVFIGYKVRGLRGAVAASLGAVLPSFLIILIVAIFFAGIPALAVWGLGWSPVLLIAAGAAAGIGWTLTIGKRLHK